MIHVIATIELQPGARTQFLEAFHALVPKVHAEAGCLEYGPTIDVETNIDVQGPPRADVVTVVEKWDSLESLEAHLIAPHMIQYRNDVKPLVVATRIQVLEPA
jgi:quinol monooxygenase YgiN